jgi:hypothetical protein
MKQTRETEWRQILGGAETTREQLMATPGVEVVDIFKIGHGFTTVTIYQTPDGRTWWDDDVWPHDRDRRIVQVREQQVLARKATLPRLDDPYQVDPELNLAAAMRRIHDLAHDIPYTRAFARLDDLRRRACAQLCEATDACWHACLDALQLHDDFPASQYAEALARGYGDAMRQIQRRSLAKLAEYGKGQIKLAPVSYDYWVGRLYPGRYRWPERAPGMEGCFGNMDAWLGVLGLIEAGRALPFREQLAQGYQPAEEPQVREVRRVG